MQLTNAWKTFISTNPDSHELDTNSGLIAASFRTQTKPEDFLKLLTDIKALVLLTKPAFGSQIQLSYFHYIFGSALLSQKKSSIAILGLNIDSPVEFDPEALPKYSSNAYVPDIDGLLQTNTIAALDAITEGTHKERVKNVAVIVPNLAHILSTLTDLNPKNVLLHTILFLNKLERKPCPKLTHEHSNQHILQTLHHQAPMLHEKTPTLNQLQ